MKRELRSRIAGTEPCYSAAVERLAEVLDAVSDTVTDAGLDLTLRYDETQDTWVYHVELFDKAAE